MVTSSWDGRKRNSIYRPYDVANSCSLEVWDAHKATCSFALDAACPITIPSRCRSGPSLRRRSQSLSLPTTICQAIQRTCVGSITPSLTNGIMAQTNQSKSNCRLTLRSSLAFDSRSKTIVQLLPKPSRRCRLPDFSVRFHRSPQGTTLTK